MGDKEARISLSGSPHRSHHAPGTSTPFPMTPVKFEYPEEIPGGKHQQPSSPFRASATASERHEFAQTLQRALRNLKPKPFTLNVKFKTPPSIVASRRRASARVPSPTISSSGTISTIVSIFYICHLFWELSHITPPQEFHGVVPAWKWVLRGKRQ